MSYDVVVVGGGIGGLTVAALLSARGVNVCLLERQSRVGGCVARVEFSGYDFEPGMGLYSSWEPGEIHERVFSELPVAVPETRALESPYVVRLPDGTDVKLISDDAAFAHEIGKAFPECARDAVGFYEMAKKVSDAWSRALARVPDLQTAGRLRTAQAFLPEVTLIPLLSRMGNKSALSCLQKTSARFQRFIDSQLRAFAQTSIEQSPCLASSLALSLLRRRLYSILNGPASLAERLAESISSSGGIVRVDSPVLRLAYEGDRAIGVDLLSGETVLASRAIVSNMTVWDTYGKLVGLGRTPLDVKRRLSNVQGVGAYLIYAAMEDAAAARIPAERLLAVTEWQERGSAEELSEFTFAATPAVDRRAPPGKRAVTLQAITDVEHWFTFQANEEEHETRDQEMLEAFWERLHRSLPELGAGIEVIETATPRTFYDLTRRKLGMVGGTIQTQGSTETAGPLAGGLGGFVTTSMSHLTSVPNLFMVGDTVFPGPGLASVTHSALIVANEITK
jgi:phytoene dehydrogenase-like protein